MKLGELVVEILADSAQFAEGMDVADVKLQSFGTRARETATTVAKFSAAVVAAGTATATYLVTQSIAGARELNNLSRVAGISAEEFQRLSYAAETVGISNEKLADQLKDVGDRVGDFLQANSGPMVNFFKKIAPKVGVTAAQFKNLSGPQALQLYVDSLQKANLSQNEMTFYMEAMASDSAALLPLLKDNGRALKEQGDRAAELGIVLSDIEVEKLVQAGASMRESKKTLDGLVDKFAAEFGPVIVKIGDDFLSAMAGSNDFGAAVDNAFNHAVNAAGFVIDAVDGIRRTFNLAADGIIWAFSTAMRGVVDAATWVLEKLSMLPGVDYSDTIKDLQQFSVEATGIADQAAANMHDTLSKPPPSEGFKEYVAEVRQEAEAAAAAVVNLRENTRTEERNKPVPTGSAALTDAQAQQRMDILRSLADSEEELRTNQFATEIEQINAFYQGKVGLEDEWREILKQKEQDFQHDLFKIRMRGTQSVEDLLKTHYGWQISEAYTAGRDALAAFSQHSKKAFELNKAVKLGEAVVTGYQAAVAAWAHGMSAGGPVLAAAYTGASLLKTGALIRSIQSQQYGSGGGGAAGAAGGGVASGAAGTAGQQAPASTFIAQVERVGDGGLSESALSTVMDQINNQIRDGKVLTSIEMI